jgi:hypothetical protein
LDFSNLNHRRIEQSVKYSSSTRTTQLICFESSRKARATKAFEEFFGVINQAAINVKKANKKYSGKAVLVRMNWYREKFDFGNRNTAVTACKTVKPFGFALP